ncbi:hypothetical protein [Burkholderia ambifaria]|uniref:DUF2345 domain-containing protein n=1 Tax=Burkholderia ambifaria IOP40-10 TaxID=396596 RepID=B1FBE5_9BURK|nr:hypothetical protein [Burkholderia ambifaria]EDT05141.1 conserved hypothetical protein [Burkholderia ambifaria IOP40-10]
MNLEIECLLPPDTSAADPESAAAEPPAAIEDELVFEAKQKITLRCGKASITLYPNGKIALRGEYIVSDAAGVNRIAGGQVELN